MNTPLVLPWKPRASAIGSYWKCLWRAASDRAIYEGTLSPSVKSDQRQTGNADLGSCEHFELQDGIKCVFPGPPKNFAPTADKWASAASLFGGDLDVTRSRVRAAAELAATQLPKAPDGLPWRAEDTHENALVTGHTDFLSQDFSVIGDLKTTSHPLVNDSAKAEHVLQMAVYNLLVPTASRGFILYVDSMRAMWCTLVWIDFTTDEWNFFLDRLEAFLRFITGPALFDVAYPNFGDHCHQTWCGFKAGCRDSFIPKRGIKYDLSARRPVTPGRIEGVAYAPPIAVFPGMGPRP